MKSTWTCENCFTVIEVDSVKDSGGAEILPERLSFDCPGCGDEMLLKDLKDHDT